MILRMTAPDLVRRTSRRIAAAVIAFGIAAALAVVAATPSDAHPVPQKPLKVSTVGFKGNTVQQSYKITGTSVS
jgi:hypothetical protein